MNETVHLLRWIFGTPVVALAFLLCFLLQIILICTIFGIILVADSYDQRASGYFEPALALAKVVYA